MRKERVYRPERVRRLSYNAVRYLYVGEFLEAHNGAVTAIATCFIAGFTFILWRATTRQARITDAALVLAS
jgi:hypothetical protein